MLPSSPEPSGYLARRRASPSGLALVVALHGAAVAAALLAKGAGLIAPGVEPMRVVNVPLEQVPPDLPPPPPAEPDSPLPSPVPSRVSVPTDPPVTPPVDPPPALPAPPPPAPPSDPVLIDARFDPAHFGALQPPYPSRMQRAGREGSVTIRVRIAADGRVTAVQKVRADDDAFYEATRRHALAHWRFVPATRDGRPVASWQRHTVRFELTG